VNVLRINEFSFVKKGMFLFNLVIIR
jgi:hypothetical protein